MRLVFTREGPHTVYHVLDGERLATRGCGRTPREARGRALKVVSELTGRPWRPGRRGVQP